MRRIVVVAVATVVSMAVVAGPAWAEPGGRPFTTSLTGAAEIPGPGDPDASGSAIVALNQGLGTVCFTLAWEDVDGSVVAAHIHAGTSTAFGPIVVTLLAGASLDGTDSASGCASDVDRDLIKTIRQQPSGFYVNVHSTVFPGGAIRGQLGK